MAANCAPTQNSEIFLPSGLYSRPNYTIFTTMINKEERLPQNIYPKGHSKAKKKKYILKKAYEIKKKKKLLIGLVLVNKVLNNSYLAH